MIDPATQPFAEFYCVGQSWRFNLPRSGEPAGARSGRGKPLTEKAARKAGACPLAAIPD